MSQTSTGLSDSEKRTGRTGLLADFVDSHQLAKELDRCERTIRNWMNEPNGMPYAMLGYTRIIHIPTARKWLMSRMRQRNSDRRRRGRTR
jgi:hypothetical protein